MDMSQGFPLYTSANEYLIFAGQTELPKSFKDTEIEQKVLRIANMNMVLDTILQVHLPNLIRYVYLAGESMESIFIHMDTDEKGKMLSYGIATMDTSNIIENLEEIAVSSWIYFENGIRNKKFFDALVDNDLLEGDIDNNKNLYVQLTPISNYIRINMIMSVVFKTL